MSLDAGAIVGKLEMSTKGWTDSVEKVKADQKSLAGLALRHSEAISNLGKTMAVTGAAMAASLTALVMKTADYGDKINDLSQRTGVATTVLSGYKLAADNSGTSLDGVATAFKFLSQRMVDFKAGGEESIALFKTLGVEVTNADGSLRDSNEVMLDVAERFSQMEDGAEKTALAVKLFGRSGMELIPFLNMGKEGLRENYENAKKFGSVVSQDAARACDDFNDKLGNMKSALGGAAREIGAQVLPHVKELVEKVTEAAVKFRAWAAEHPGLISSLGSVALTIGGVLSGLGPLLIAIPKVVQGWTTLTAVLQTSTAALAATLAGLVALAAGAVMVYSSVRTMIKAKEDSVEADYEMSRSNDEVGKKLRAMADAAGVSRAELNKLTDAYGGNNLALQVAINKGKDQNEAIQKLHGWVVKHREQVDNQTTSLDAQSQTLGDLLAAQEAAKKRTEEYTSFLGSLGIPTEAERAQKIEFSKRALVDLHDKMRAGQITQSEYYNIVSKINDGLDELHPKLKGITVALQNQNPELSALEQKWVDFWRSQSGGVDQVQDDVNACLDRVVEWNKRANEKLKGETNQTVSVMAQAWANMVTEIAQGWSEAFVKMFGLTDALIGESTHHIQEYFDQAVEDLNGEWEKTKEIYAQMLDEVNAYYDAIREQAASAYDDSRDALGEEYDAKEKTLRREYEDRRDWIRENVKDEAERKRQLKELAREYEDNVDNLHKEEKDKLKQMEAEYQAYLKSLKEQELAREKEIAAEKKAAEEAYQAELARIRADEERSREEHAASELARQNSLWTKVKTVFGNAVEGMLTAWVTTFVSKWLATITDKILPGMDKIKTTGIDAGEKAGNALAGIGNSIKGIVTSILDVIEAIATTIIDIVAYAITTLAQAIATAINALAAAAPALLELGLVAAAIYTAFKLGESLVGAIGNIIGGGGGNSDITDWLKVIYDTIVLYGIALGGHLIFLSDRLVEMFPKIDNLAGCINTARQAIWDILLILVNRVTDFGNKIINGLAAIKTAIQSIPQAAGGGASMASQLMMVHGTPEEPEYIVPHNDLGAFIAGLPRALGPGAAPADTRPVQVVFRPVVIPRGDKWQINFIQDNLDHGALRVPVRSIGG